MKTNEAKKIDQINKDIKGLELENETTTDLNRIRVIRRTLHVLITALQQLKS